MNNVLLTVSSVFGLLLLLTIPSTAYGLTITVYTDKNQWENDVFVDGQFTTEDFTGAAAPGFDGFTSDNGNIAGGQFNDVLVPGGNPTIFDFSPRLDAWGGDFDLFNPGGPGTGIIVELMDGTMATAGEIPNTTDGFWGLTSDMNFQAVHLESGTQSGVQETYDLDNMVFSHKNSVGGDMISLDSTMILVAGSQNTAAWMIPAIISAIGIGLVIARKI